MNQIEAFRVLYTEMRRRHAQLRALCEAMREMIVLSGCERKEDQLDVACEKEVRHLRALRERLEK